MKQLKCLRQNIETILHNYIREVNAGTSKKDGEYIDEIIGKLAEAKKGG